MPVRQAVCVLVFDDAREWYGTYVVIRNVGQIVGSDELPDSLDELLNRGRLGELIWVEFDV